MSNLALREKQILEGLKDFQRATVERVFDLYTSGHNRVLVADEVGLGKTLIARGVIAKTAVYHQKKDLFKVVYICSNQSIASQNLTKLKINKTDSIETLSDTRLSMQHLKIFEGELTAQERKNYIQLIPLTPGTSFNMTGGSGSVLERALIFAVLRRHKGFSRYLDGLEKLMIANAEKSWSWYKEHFEKRVSECNKASCGRYLKTMEEHLNDYFDTHDELLAEVTGFCMKIEQKGERPAGAFRTIHKLRQMMAEIGAEMLDADLVIMDEFQRFPELIKNDDDSETAVLARRFFNPAGDDNQNTKILLLSATPYKLYSTLEEISESQADEHYREFMEVTDFLFENNPEQKAEFRQVWRDYSVTLNEIGTTDLTILTARKNKAEDVLYQGICRTERLSVKDADSLVDAANNTLEIAQEDVISYVQAARLLEDIGLQQQVPVDYIKSAPYIFSFMEDYKLKTKVFDYFRQNPDKLTLARRSGLWVNERSIARYKKLPDTNARLKRLQDEALPPGAELLLWLPPSRPYYEPGTVFSRVKDFSKVLVFSSWVMVPRAIATMLSYEAERLTIGALIRKSPGTERENRSYFPQDNKVRFPRPRLRFSMRDNQPANMTLMSLVYPCVTLAKLYNPVDYLNAGLTQEQIQAELRNKIKALLAAITFTPKQDEIGHDERWYSAAPILFDRNEKMIQDWLNKPDVFQYLQGEETQGNSGEDDDRSALQKHFDELRDILHQADNAVLGRQPQDLADVLVDMAMASPAVCALRLLGTDLADSSALAARFAKTLLDQFNIQEATSIVELCYGSERPHWKNVLRYCVDGNLQAVLDEYAHILIDDNGLRYTAEDIRAQRLCELMEAAIKTTTASYNVDTYPKFRYRVKRSQARRRSCKKPGFIRMRTGYAVGFYDVGGREKSLQRKDSLRKAFNSPFRPFVLATTSVGQEGLDFHFYCRKVVHWNLPSNPIDIEQREGRINRYKCLAIRQNIAKKYGDIHFQEDIWREMFARAHQEEKDDNCPELVPFWCLAEDTPVKIERIVPMYPLSRDQAKYERLIKILSLYRLSLGQPRQQELLEYVLQTDL
ncbi:MAG: hypothetical protein GX964_02860, partial [Syntrophomonadaceae bacterium]|nr:hypothetical protein [Syntrophomonadaceae bacterium]